ncbi:MAG: lamin tail domain-containing protein [Verrucomicrobia bacterium]|nr:lamin tail domain-containing protein [Verrucomicrobiota bacterium]
MNYFRALARLLCFAMIVLSAAMTPAVELVPAHTQWKLFPGRSEASTPDTSAWRQLNFDDSPWQSGDAPFYFGLPLNGTQLTDMPGSYTSVFLRRKFSVPVPGNVAELQFEALSDDGFIAWINGREVVRYNVPEGELAFNATATGALPGLPATENFSIANPSAFLITGENTLAVQAFNASLTASADFAFDTSLTATIDSAPPVVENIIPEPGSTVRELVSVEVHFDETVNGVDAEDLLINGLGATNVIEVAQGKFVFSFPEPADGPVQIAWRANHGITDRTGSAHPFAGGNWSYQLDANSPSPDVFISEFMADNKRTLHDEDGDSSDWIELFNAGTTPASLDGWFLTDDAANLIKWRVPEIELTANSYFVIFASAKNRTNVTSRLHTNFKLPPKGGYLALVSPAGKVISDFAPGYPAQSLDVSYGRVPGAPQILGFFTQPTPGAPNTASGPGFAAEIKFSRASGTVIQPFDLALTTESSNAVIRYTLDGSLPTNSSPAYVAPLRIGDSVQVRARAFENGLFPSPPRSESYLLLSNNVVDFASDLPVLIIHDLGKGAPSATRPTFAHISVYEPVNGVTSLRSPPTLATRAAINLRGSSTLGLPKISLAVEFRDEFERDLHHEILGLPAESDWVLYAPNEFEPVLIHNPFIHQLSRDMGRYSSRTRFVEVYLNTRTGPIAAANYFGIYVLEEKIKIGKHRIDIDKLEPEHINPPEVTGGYAFKVDRTGPGESGFVGAGQQMVYVDPNERTIKLAARAPQRQYLKDFFAEFGKALGAADWTDSQLGYPAYFDVDAGVDFHVLEVLSGNVDAMVLSTYLHKPRNGKITYGPHWDFDRALGSTDGRDQNPRNWNTGPFFGTGWWTRLLRDPDFWQKWIDRYQELRETHLSRTNMNALIDRLTDEVRQAQPRERKRWKIGLRGGTYQSEIDRMKNWLSNRVDYIDQQIAQPPALSAGGGLVAPGSIVSILVQTNATVYFTLDGSDPRLPQGNISLNATVYSEPIRIEASARLVARAFNSKVRQRNGPPLSSPWSRAIAATFTVAPPPLIVTEIMFHPAASASSTNTATDFEFIELKNSSTSPVNLAGYRFTDGIQFAFSATSGVSALAPGERVLVAKNRAAFVSRYPAITNVVGDFTGSLAQSGERLRLEGPLQQPIVDFTFAGDWFPLADGFGFSLVLADETIPSSELGAQSSWRLSANVGGSPGQIDPMPVSLPPIFINEVRSNPGATELDALELYNPNAQPIDVTGWFLSDDFRTPKKFRIPPTSIDANAYVVFDTSDFQTAGATGFAFSKFGDEAYVFSADANGNLTGWFHGFQFGAVETSATLGRHVNSVGEDFLVEQTRPSLGVTNAGPRVGPVVISEIMFAPALNGLAQNSLDEFIELQNLSTEAVVLYDPAHPENTWRLRGAVDFDFPAGTILPAKSYLVVVSFDPLADENAAAAFRARYGLELTAPLVGPWQGQLDNAGDEIKLRRSGVPEIRAAANGLEVPQVLVERIAFRAGAPWPTNAAGTGLALVRRDTAAFGDDPANWFAAPPSPGDADTDGDGLPDRWEIANGLDPFSAAGENGALADPDNDGFNNWQEFLAGTSPQDAGSLFQIEAARLLTGELSLQFNTVPGRRYTIQFRDNFNSGAWQLLRTFIAPPGSNSGSVTDATANATRFYRVKLP